ncbi:zinc finger CCCH-type antiviral protein 1-like isoform X2 [Penaeus japonicus]|nr:zinc finger CCCH-type antiviral protein 1-like isoform X2 [Penaeus japonicus]
MNQAGRPGPRGDGEPQKFSQDELVDLVSDLDLSRAHAELLVSRLKEKCLLKRHGTNARSRTPPRSPQIQEICYKSVSGACNDAACPRIHSRMPFHWQVTGDLNTWFDFPEKIVLFLEDRFCDPKNDFLVLPSLGDSCSNRDLLRLLRNALSDIVFKHMEWVDNCAFIPIRNANRQLHIRRLCIEKCSAKELEANLFTWYFQDDFENWIPFQVSDDCKLEYAYQLDPQGFVSIYAGSSTYKVDFSKMIQENVKTHTKRGIRRRPRPQKQLR